jgi:hypothetical protein
MPAKYVRPYSKGQKNDFRDAEAIAEAVQRPTMKFVATKTADQLDLQALHRVCGAEKGLWHLQAEPVGSLEHGKGIILMHDFQHATAEAMPELLRQLKAAGYKVVHMVPKVPVTTLAKYDDMVRAKDKMSVANTRPESSVIRTIGE